MTTPPRASTRMNTAKAALMTMLTNMVPAALMTIATSMPMNTATVALMTTAPVVAVPPRSW